jgi:hypothetical protein
MYGIMMCNNEQCPLSYSCWRFNSPPKKHQQLYTKFEPQIDEVLDEVECKMNLEVPDDKPTLNQN